MKQTILIAVASLAVFTLGVLVGAWIAPTVTSARYQYEYGKLQLQHSRTVEQANEAIQDLQRQADQARRPVVPGEESGDEAPDSGEQ